MLNKIVRIILSVSIAGSALLNNSIETAETKFETTETKLESNETEYETSTTTVIFEQNPDIVSQLKDEIHETRNWDEGCYDDTIEVSQKEAEMLLKIAYAEGGSEGIKGQLLIMQVVWNRVLSENFPNDIESVIFQTNAFTSVTEGKYDIAEPTWETHVALAQFEANKNHDYKVIGFETVDNGNALLKFFDFYFIYGNHCFYKIKD